jgi:hypothetical protein
MSALFFMNFHRVLPVGKHVPGFVQISFEKLLVPPTAFLYRSLQTWEMFQPIRREESYSQLSEAFGKFKVI